MIPTDSNNLLTAEEVSQRLRLPLSTVYHFAKTGKLQAVQIGRSWRFPAEGIAAVAGGAMPATGVTSPSKVLVVDDDEVTRLFVKDVLEERDFQVAEAANYHEGYRVALKQRFDLLIIDYNLPGGDGNRLIHDLREEYSMTQILMITAYSEIAQMDSLLDLGVVTLLRKPFSAELIIDYVQRIMSQKPAEPIAPAPGTQTNPTTSKNPANPAG